MQQVWKEKKELVLGIKKKMGRKRGGSGNRGYGAWLGLGYLLDTFLPEQSVPHLRSKWRSGRLTLLKR